MNAHKAANFDRLARPYLALERLAFGRDLERARFRFVDALAGSREVLVLGEGDGRFLARAVEAAPEARFLCVDASSAMQAMARGRLSGAARERVTFVHGDARAVELGSQRFDAAVTLFFLDCFTPAEAGALIPRIASALRPAAQWLYADFDLPAAGWRRWRARAWLTLLYTFFRLETRLSARALPPADALIRAQGFAPAEESRLQHGLLRSTRYCRPGGSDRTRDAT